MAQHASVSRPRLSDVHLLHRHRLPIDEALTKMEAAIDAWGATKIATWSKCHSLWILSDVGEVWEMADRVGQPLSRGYAEANCHAEIGAPEQAAWDEYQTLKKAWSLPWPETVPWNFIGPTDRGP